MNKIAKDLLVGSLRSGTSNGNGASSSDRTFGGLFIVSASTEGLRYSESFIRAHIDLLPGNPEFIYGSPLPTRSIDGAFLVSESRAQRLWRRVSMHRNGITSTEYRGRRLEAYLRQAGARAILAEYGPSGVIMMGICRRMQLPLIVHFHGYDAYEKQVLEQHEQDYRALFRTATAIIAVSRDMEAQLLDLGAPRERLHLNPYGVDVQQFGGAQPASSPVHFVNVGRFVSKKGPHLTLLAMKQVLQRFPSARLTMIGDGPLLESSQHLARALQMADAVHFTGALGHAQVGDMLRSARAYVQHSIRCSFGDSEGTPVSILEAGASGLPAVATRHGGITDVIVDGETGYLVDETDVDAMAQRMIALAESPETAGVLGAAARRRVEENYSMERSIENLWSIIDCAMSENTRAPGSR